MRWKPALNAFAINFADRMPGSETVSPNTPLTPLIGQSLSDPLSPVCSAQFSGFEVGDDGVGQPLASPV